jgi:hypothetical protein
MYLALLLARGQNNKLAENINVDKLWSFCMHMNNLAIATAGVALP